MAESIDPTPGAALDEWKECRATIDRFDKILVDLRKTGFGFLTALAAAAPFIFDKIGIEKVGSFAPKVSLLVLLVLLIVTLYLIDVTHQAWLGVAVRRAKALETEQLSFALTNLISQEFKAARAAAVGFVLYFFLLTATCAVFWFTVPLGEQPTSGHHLSIAAVFVVGLLGLVGTNVLSTGDSLTRRRFIAMICLFAIAFAATHFGLRLF